jgi:hypothetical protein
MKTKISLIFGLIVTVLGLSARYTIPHFPQNIPFISSVYYPKEVQNPQKLAILYKGTIYKPTMYPAESVSNKADLEIVEDRNTSEFHFLVTESLQVPKDHAITHLYTSKDHPYRLFKLVRKTKYDQPTEEAIPTVSYYWDIIELENEQSSKRLAENTIVLLMDPALIELEPTSWKPDDIFITLPTIAFKKIENEEAFNTLCRRMLFSLMDVRFLHKESSKTSKHIAANCIVSLPNPSNRFMSS